MPGIKFTNIEQFPGWIVGTGPSIANNIPDKYFPSQTPTGLRMTMISSLPFSGWLLKMPLPIMPLIGAGQIALDYDLKTDDQEGAYTQGVETDIMGVMPDGRVANCSGQNNRATGHWQIVNSLYKWVDAAPVAPLPVDQFVHHSFRYAWDFTKGVSSVLSGSINGVPFAVDPTMQNIPLADLKWSQPPHLVMQLQQTGNAKPGAWSVEFANVDVEAIYN